MIKGVYVNAQNNAAHIVSLTAELNRVDDPRCQGSVKPGNFQVDNRMQASLEMARDACIHYLTLDADLWENYWLPLLASPISARWQFIVGISFFGCLIFPLGWLGWIMVQSGPLPWWLLNPMFFTLFALFLLGVVIITLPWKTLFLGLYALFKGEKEWRNLLEKGCFAAYAEQNRRRAPNHFFGDSAGLVWFATFVEAAAKSGKQGFFPAWQEHLLGDVRHWVASVALVFDSSWKFASIGEVENKLQAIWDYNQLNPQHPLNLAVFSRTDQALVDTAWPRIADENLDYLPGSPRTARSLKARLTFLFCNDLKTFLRFLHPYRLRWLAVRLAAIFAILGSAVFMKISTPVPPEFAVECSCFQTATGVQYTRLSPGENIPLTVNIASRGFLGTFQLNVVSNVEEKTLSDVPNGERQNELNHPAVNQDALQLFFTMPKDSPQNVVVVITIINQAGKWSQSTIFFIPEDSQPLL